jgi:transcriptional regulator with XRE-family HTH domain
VGMNRLKTLRKGRGWTQEEAAKRLGLIRSTYSNYESGKREPDFDTAKAMAEFFEVSVDYLLGGSRDQAKNLVMEAYDRLPQEEKKVIADMIDVLEKRRQK